MKGDQTPNTAAAGGKNVIRIAVICVVVLLVSIHTVIAPAVRYQIGVNKLAQEDYAAALEQLEQLGNYKDAPALVREAELIAQGSFALDDSYHHLTPSTPRPPSPRISLRRILRTLSCICTSPEPKA